MTAALVLATTGTLASVELASSQRADPRPPNIVLITSDDQTAVELRWMPRTRRLLGRAGVTFSDMVAPHPNCCPSRAQILSGQYAHNNGVRTNGPPWVATRASTRRRHCRCGCSGPATRPASSASTCTATTSDGIEPGWDRWRPIVGVLSDYRLVRCSTPTASSSLRPRGLPHRRGRPAVPRSSATSVRVTSRSSCGPASRPARHLPGQPEPDCSGPPPAAERHATSSATSDSRRPRLALLQRGAGLGEGPRHVRPSARSRTDAQRLFTQRFRALAALDEAVAGIVEALDRRASWRTPC